MYTSEQTYDSGAQQWLSTSTILVVVIHFHTHFIPNFPISRLSSPRRCYHTERYLFSLFDGFESFLSGFGSRKYWKYSVSLPFRCRSSDTFRKPEYLLPSSKTRAIYFLSWPSSPFFTISKETHSERTFAMILFFFLVFFTSSTLFISFLAKTVNFRWWQKRASENGNEMQFEWLWPTFQPNLRRKVALRETLTPVTGNEAITFISFMIQKSCEQRAVEGEIRKTAEKSILRVRKKSEQKIWHSCDGIWHCFCFCFCRTQH